MKRLLFSLLVCVSLLLFYSPTLFAAASTITQSVENVYGNVFKITFTCTASSTDGSFLSTVTSDNDVDGYVFLVETDPDSGVNPTASYDIVLNNSLGLDIMGGELGDRSATAEEQAVPLMDAVYGTRFVDGTISPVITNNSVNSAVVIIYVYFYREE